MSIVETEQKMEDQPEELRVRGLLVPIDWNTHGDILRAAILDADERQYDLADLGTDGAILSAIREVVEARLISQKGTSGRDEFVVRSLTVVNAIEPEFTTLRDLQSAPDGGV